MHRRDPGSGRRLAADREELAPALVAQGVAAAREQRRQGLGERVAERCDRLLRAPVGAAQRLRHDAVDDPEPQQILCGQPQRLGRLGGMLAVTP